MGAVKLSFNCESCVERKVIAFCDLEELFVCGFKVFPTNYWKCMAGNIGRCLVDDQISLR